MPKNFPSVKLYHKAIIFALLLPVFGLSGCSDNMSRSDMGGLSGAVIGGLVGNNFGKGNGRVAATLVGVFAGGIIGTELGRALDERDRDFASRAEYEALENGRSGRSREWRNPENGHYGEVIPEPAYKVGQRNCRRYRHRVYIDGRPQTMRGTACRNGDGTWSNMS